VTLHELVALRHPQRRSDRAQPGRREDQAQSLGAAPELVPNHKWEQDLERTHEQQQRCRGSQQGRPKPGLRAHEGEALADLASDLLESRRLSQSTASRAHQAHADGGDAECRGVGEERRARAEPGDEQAADGRAGEAVGDRLGKLIKRVRLEQQRAGNDLGDRRLVRRREERLSNAVHGNKHDHVPKLDRSR